MSGILYSLYIFISSVNIKCLWITNNDININIMYYSQNNGGLIIMEQYNTKIYLQSCTLHIQFPETKQIVSVMAINNLNWFSTDKNTICFIAIYIRM